MANEIIITENFIDIEKLFADKNPRLHKLLPGIIFKYLKKKIHQDFINATIFRHRDKFGLPFVSAIIEDFGLKIEVSSMPQSLVSGRYIIASNHPLGGPDGLALIHVIGQIRPDLVFPVNDLLTYIPGLKPLFIPINKHGKNTENIGIIDQTFASDKVILYFPAGLVSRKQRHGIIKDLPWKKTFISKAKKYKRDIIPVYISGRNSDFFYNLANWRRRLGIKANIEMLFLPDEMQKQRGKIIKLVFGDPIPYSGFDRSRSDTQWAEMVKDKVYSLKELVE